MTQARASLYPSQNTHLMRLALGMMYIFVQESLCSGEMKYVSLQQQAFQSFEETSVTERRI